MNNINSDTGTDQVPINIKHESTGPETTSIDRTAERGIDEASSIAASAASAHQAIETGQGPSTTVPSGSVKNESLTSESSNFLSEQTSDIKPEISEAVASTSDNAEVSEAPNTSYLPGNDRPIQVAPVGPILASSSSNEAIATAAAAAAAAAASILDPVMAAPNNDEITAAAVAAVAPASHVPPTPSNDDQVVAAAAAVAAAAVVAPSTMPSNHDEAVAAACAAAAASAALSQSSDGGVLDLAVAVALSAGSTVSNTHEVQPKNVVPSVAILPATTADGNQRGDRDVVLDQTTLSMSRKTSVLMQDLIRLERVLWKLDGKANPTKAGDVSQLVDRIVCLVTKGKSYELAGLKDVPYPFMKSTGRFIVREREGTGWKKLSDEHVKPLIAKIVLEAFSKDDLGRLDNVPFTKFKELLEASNGGTETMLTTPIMPQDKDPILLQCSENTAEKLYENHSGNKAFFNLASQLVTSSTNSTHKRVEAALTIINLLKEVSPLSMEGSGQGQTSMLAMYPRFLVRTLATDESVGWQVLSPARAAEFSLIFVFEVFLEKDVETIPDHDSDQSNDENDANNSIDISEPGTVPVRDPTDHDVLFGRGGMTNSHPGNRRFRDVIALHRPDYIRAIKMDKPAVARKIVKAIRHGNPPGRFLRKGDDGRWYDVGDRTAAEKTSQGLRERTNAEKRQRSAVRESLRMQKHESVEDIENPSKKAKGNDTRIVSETISPLPKTPAGSDIPAPGFVRVKAEGDKVGARKKAEGKDEKVAAPTAEWSTEGLPPNAVDSHGNILVTDYDILCGRGGLTNHHKGNKRFRDIVALHRSDYVRAPKIQKPSVARVIVRAIRNGDPPGRFLKKNEKSGKWVDVGDKKAAEKTSQALREKTNEERDQHKPDNVGLGTGVSLPSAAASVGPTIDNGTQAVSSSKLEACVVPNPVGVEAIMSATAEVRGTQSSGPLSGELKAAAHGGIPLAGQTSSTALAPTLMVAGAASLPDNRAKATEVATNVDSALETSSPTVGTQHETKEKEKSCLSAEI